MCGAHSLNRCVKCKLAWYCSAEHQKVDWKMHKAQCRPGQHALDLPQLPRTSGVAIDPASMPECLQILVAIVPWAVSLMFGPAFVTAMHGTVAPCPAFAPAEQVVLFWLFFHPQVETATAFEYREMVALLSDAPVFTRIAHLGMDYLNETYATEKFPSLCVAERRHEYARLVEKLCHCISVRPRAFLGDPLHARG